MYFENYPILTDFTRFIDYVGKSNGLEITREKKELRNTDLVKLNDLMHFRMGIVYPKAKQISFYLLNTFFYIGVTSDLFQIVSRNNKNTLLVYAERVKQYFTLSDDEKYFFLLESFWCYVPWDQAYDCRYFGEHRFFKRILKKSGGKPMSISNKSLKRKGDIESPTDLFVVEMFQAFGFVELTWDENVAKRPTRYECPYKSIELTLLGMSMIPILLEERSQVFWGEKDPYMTEEIEQRIKEMPDFSEDFGDFGDFFDFSMGKTEKKETLSPIEPEEDVQDEETEIFSDAFLIVLNDLKIENTLYPISRPFVGGQFTFRVSLDPKCSRDIIIGASQTLSDLHDAIQDAFNFDDDHLYAFYLNGKYGSSNDTYNDPRGLLDEGKYANIYKIGELGLIDGHNFVYLFDFGDDWEFNIAVIDIDTAKKEPKKYKIVNKIGKAPEQYGDSEDDYDNEEDE
jgi:hypothetical protein